MSESKYLQADITLNFSMSLVNVDCELREMQALLNENHKILQSVP